MKFERHTHRHTHSPHAQTIIRSAFAVSLTTRICCWRGVAWHTLKNSYSDGRQKNGLLYINESVAVAVLWPGFSHTHKSSRLELAWQMCGCVDCETTTTTTRLLHHKNHTDSSSSSASSASSAVAAAAAAAAVLQWCVVCAFAQRMCRRRRVRASVCTYDNRP